jgi:WhiB family transcriptional regulator, redox-sensing transcriptional regulator
MSDALTLWLMVPDAPDVPLTLEELVNRPSWHRKAACRGHGPGEFIRGPRATYDTTRALCAVCRVRRECLDYALADPNLTGLWGGTDDQERRELRRAAA